MPGCPACGWRTVTDRTSTGCLWAVLDPDVRAKLKAPKGSAVVTPRSQPPARARPRALIYRDIIRTMAERLEKGSIARAVIFVLGREYAAGSLAPGGPAPPVSSANNRKTLI